MECLVMTIGTVQCHLDKLFLFSSTILNVLLCDIAT